MKYFTLNAFSMRVIQFTICFLLGMHISNAQQRSILDKELSIIFNNETLAEALTKIENKTGCIFSYTPSSLKIDTKLNKSYTNSSLRELLNDIFVANKIYYRLRGTTIHIQNNAKKAKVEGTIKTTEGNAAPFVSVLLKGTSFGSLSDENGFFSFYAPEGEYIIVTSFMGLKNQSQAVSILLNKNNQVSFVLKEDSETLQEVEIIGRKATTYKNDITYAATKTATKIKDIPQAVSYVTKEVFADQQAYRVNEIVKNISGVNQYSWYDDFTIRGFRSGETYINGLRVEGLFGPRPLLANLERVEVLKGPASAMFGNASPGGTMNRVTKKPLVEDRKSVNFTTGSYNTLRASLDFTGSMNEKDNLLYRLNIAYENSGSFRDLQETKTLMIAPSISFLPTDKTRINFDLVIQQFDGKLDRGQPIYGASSATDLEDPNNTPINFAIAATNDYHISDVNYFTLSLNHKFTENISFNSSYMKYITNEDLFEHSTSNSYAVDGNGNEIATLMAVEAYSRQRKKSTDNISNYFVIRAENDKIKHKILLGLDYAQQERPIGGAEIWADGNEYYKNDGTIAAFDPENISNFVLDNDGNPVPNVPHFDLENPTYSLAYPSDYILSRGSYSATKYSTVGYYIQDQITIKKLQVLLGLRYNTYTDYTNYKTDNVEKVKQNKLIPRLGLVYEINNQINAYGTYTESFEPQYAGDLGLEVGGPFDPLQGQMVEVGLKGEFFNKRLAANLAIYSIIQKNELIEDPNDFSKYVQIGETSSKGVELDITGRISKNLSVTANYAFNKAIFESTPAVSDFKKGDTRQNAPKHQGGFFAKYKILNGTLKGIGFNLGTNFVSERNSTDGPELKFPSYQIVDFGATYQVEKFVLRVTVNNLFDKTHWVGGYNYVRLFPGAPRNYLLSVGYTL